jgi:hypothetical protein
MTYTLYHHLGPDAVDPPYGALPRKAAPDVVVIDWTNADSQIDE